NETNKKRISANNRQKIKIGFSRMNDFSFQRGCDFMFTNVAKKKMPFYAQTKISMSLKRWLKGGG
ncbi:hypothetical protein, partial [Caldilinea sp.]|uniref:hypothetical protein n=1 Tax=Caldilinea sp. TaxID=2293560 RepID=UPI001B20523C